MSTTPGNDPVPQTRPQLKLIRKQRGHLAGIAPQTLIFRLRTDGGPKIYQVSTISTIANWLSGLEISGKDLINDLGDTASDRWQSLSLLAMEIVSETQTIAGLKLSNKAKCIRSTNGSYALLLPSSLYTWEIAAKMLHDCFSTLLGLKSDQETTKAIHHFLQYRQEMRSKTPQNANTLPFLTAAQSLGVPTEHVAAHIYRFGWGASSALMDSSLTHSTSAIGCNAARDKLIAKKLLHDAGLPVAAGSQVGTPEEAWIAAQKLGLPCVVKPKSADRGLEVHVKLSSKDEVEKAAEAVLASKHQILVERYHTGKDYRLQVYRDSVSRCVERTPGGIVGDGKGTIRERLEDLNRQPDRGPLGSGKSKFTIDFDLEAERVLSQHNLSMDSVPEKGQFVPLRSAANVSRGGEKREVLELAHPDNLALACRATEALHLDLAGIDLLISDISRSWLEVGGVICEVNAQPQIAIGHEKVLTALLGGNGRIPIDVILGLDGIDNLRMAIADHGDFSFYPSLGLVGRDGVFVGDQRFHGPPTDQFHAASMLLRCPRVDRLILALWDASRIEDGLPIDKFSRLIIISAVSESTQAAAEQDLHQINKLAAILAPMSDSCCTVSKISDIVDLLEDER